MKKIVILGCENSHANAFLKHMKTRPELAHIQCIGVYSDDVAAAQKLHDEFDVPVMASFDEAVGKVDGIVITARHGDHHYRYAKPYMDSGVPMFIDKPITCTEADAVEFLSQLKAKGIKVTGGSSLRHAFEIVQLKQACAAQVGGSTVGGIVRAPLNMDNPYGGFYFYSQHLVEMVLEAFGRYPDAVQVTAAKDAYTVLFHYGDFTVSSLYTVGSGEYYAARFAKNGTQGGYVANQGNEWYYAEFKAFADLMEGAEPDLSYEELFSPVFVLNAIDRAITSGQRELICYPEV